MKVISFQQKKEKRNVKKLKRTTAFKRSNITHFQDGKISHSFFKSKFTSLQNFFKSLLMEKYILKSSDLSASSSFNYLLVVLIAVGVSRRERE